MRQHSDLFAAIRARPGMYVSEETYPVISAFVQGYDQACEGGVLVGFREWIITSLGYGDNLHWAALVLHVAFPASSPPRDELLQGPQQHRHAIDTLFRLIAEFEEVRSKHGGLNSVFLAYNEHRREMGI